jgi:hypothetical protein
MNFKLLGNELTSSSSTNPVMETDPKVRYAATTPSNAPPWDSLMKSALLVDVGSMTSAIEAMSDQSLWALVKGGISSHHRCDRSNYGEHTGLSLPGGGSWAWPW